MTEEEFTEVFRKKVVKAMIYGITDDYNSRAYEEDDTIVYGVWPGIAVFRIHVKVEPLPAAAKFAAAYDLPGQVEHG